MFVIRTIIKSTSVLLLIIFCVGCTVTNNEKAPTTTQEIIEKHLSKVGGNLLGSSIKTLQLVSEASYEDGSTVTTTSRFEFPNKLNQNELYAGAVQDYILNDTIGFSIKNNMQFKALNPFEVRNLQENAHLMTFYRWQEREWKYEYKEKQTLDNQEHFVLYGQNDSLRLNNRVFINTSTFLIKRIEVKSPTFNASSNFDDYFQKDGLQYPNETITDFGSYSVTSTVSDFLINPTFNSSIFEVKTASE